MSILRYNCCRSIGWIGFVAKFASRFFTGVASATGFMLGAGLILNWLHHNGYRQELGIHFSGIGLGIIVSALVVDTTGLDSMFAAADEV